MRDWKIYLGVVAALAYPLAVQVLFKHSAQARPVTPTSVVTNSPAADAAEQDRPANFEACHRYQVALPGAECIRGPGKPTVAIWGDSFALSWQPVAWALADRSNAAALTFSTDGCPPLLQFDATPTEKSDDEPCALRNTQAIAALSSFDTIVLAANWARYTPALTEERRAPQRETVRVALRQTLAGLAGVREVVLLAPTPVLRDNLPKCLRLGADCSITREQHETASAATRAMLMAEAARYPNVRVLDPSDYLCGSLNCPGVRDGVALYLDQTHVTHSAAEQYARRL